MIVKKDGRPWKETYWKSCETNNKQNWIVLTLLEICKKQAFEVEGQCKFVFQKHLDLDFFLTLQGNI